MAIFETFCVLCFLVFISIQLFHTWNNKNRWPFVAQNMFAHDLPDPVKRIVCIVRDTNGIQKTVFPYAILPVEFFRAQRMLIQVFLTGNDEDKQAEFAKYILDRLNNSPWIGIDEIESPVRPSDGAIFTRLTLQLRSYDFTQFAPAYGLDSALEEVTTLLECEFDVEDSEGSTPEVSR